MNVRPRASLALAPVLLLAFVSQPARCSPAPGETLWSNDTGG